MSTPTYLLEIDLGEGEIRLEPAARPLDVRVPTRLEVVDDELKPLALPRRDVHVIPGLPQPVEHVVDLELFAGVAGEDQHPLHGFSLGR